MSDSEQSNVESVQVTKPITYAGVEEKQLLRAKKAKQQRNWLKKNSHDVVCECGKVIKQYYISRHRKSELHKRNIKPSHELEAKVLDLVARIVKLEEQVHKPII